MRGLTRSVATAALTAASALAVALPGCGQTSSSGAEDEHVLSLGKRYVDDQRFRRDVLEQSLLVRDNGYATLRLERYATAGGWDELPELEPSTAPLIYQAGSRADTPPEPFWTSEVEWTKPALMALGRRAFEHWPSQPLPVFDLALGEQDDPHLQSALGLWRDKTGWVGGLLAVSYPSGASTLAASCATCHARTDASGELIHGPASDFHLTRDSDDARSGPGKVDVTPDGVANPVAIADLRATVYQRRLHWTGNLANSLEALAVRIETLLVTNSGETVRPPRQLAFALALYVQSLGEAPAPIQTSNGEAGKRVFDATCKRCHSGAFGAGDWVSLDEVGGDPTVAHSPTRGTGGFRVPALRFLSSRTRLTHAGLNGSLEYFLQPTRRDVYPGHAFGLELSAADRAALVDYLASW